MRNRSTRPAPPPAATIGGWTRGNLAPKADRAQKSGIRIGESGTRNAVYRLSTAECLALLDGLPKADPQAPYKKMIEAEYRLERLDPHHRFGGFLLALLRWWSKLDHGVFPNFFSFLDTIDADVANTHLRTPAFCASAEVDPGFAAALHEDWIEFLKTGRGVAYLTSMQRMKYHVEVIGGRAYWRGVTIGPNCPLYTGGVMTGMGGSGYIWVLDRWNGLFTGVSEVARLHHSSFSHGRAVRGAGEWQVSNGTVLRIAGITGHYRISITQLAESLRIMRDQIGLNLASASVALFRTEQSNAGPVSQAADVKADDFIDDPTIRTTHTIKAMHEVAGRGRRGAFLRPPATGPKIYGLAPDIAGK